MKNKFSITIIIMVSLLLASLTLNRGHDWGDDFASYIMQAQSIIDGKMQDFVKHNSFTVLESSYTIGPVSYPWGYPLFLVPALWLRGIHPLFLKIPGLIFFAGFLISLYFLTNNRLSRTESLLFVSLFAFNPMLMEFQDQILSDIPFLFFSTFALTLMLYEQRRSLIWSVLIGASVVLAFFVRVQGVLLLAGYFVFELCYGWLKRNDKEIVKKITISMLSACGSFVVLWAIISVVFPGGSESYFDQYNVFNLSTMFQFIGRYILIFREFFGTGVIWYFLYYVLFAFFLIGAWTRRKQETLFIIMFAIWMLFLVTWPYWQGLRFVFPLLPIFIYFMFWGVKTLVGKMGYDQHLTNIFFLLIALTFLGTSVYNAYTNLQENRDVAGPFDTYSADMFNFIQENTPSDSVIIFFKPRAMRLFTGRDSVMVLECDRLSLGDYIAIHKKWDNSQIPPDTVDECGVPLKDVYENRRFIVYEIMK